MTFSTEEADIRFFDLIKYNTVQDIANKRREREA
jgi:hypothetical protein